MSDENRSPVYHFEEDSSKGRSTTRIVLLVLAGVAVIGILIFLFTRCSANDNPDLTTDPTVLDPTITTTTLPEITTQKVIDDKGDLGVHTVEIKSHKLVKDATGKDAIIIVYNVTNNGNAVENFITVLSDMAYQGDKKLNDATLKDIENFDADSIKDNLEKGKTHEVHKAYILEDTTTPVKVEVGLVNRMNEQKVAKTFSIQQ